MNKSTATVLVIVLVVLGGGGAYLALHKSSKNSSNSSSMSNMNMNSSSNKSSNATATNQVNIKSFAFTPANITVKKGTTVTWTNNDSVAHTVTESDSQNGPKSANIDPGKTFVFTFDNPGTYHYMCSIHTEMTGTVTVTE
jgi:plastocyanin